MFNLSPKWNFPSNNHSQIIGIADSGVEMFKGTPIKSLAREICQNSLDARLDDSQPARIEFETFEIDPKNIPGAKTLEDVFNRCLDFWKIQDSDQARKFFKQAIKDMNRSSIKCLRISDFNTSGLTGSRAEYNSPWCNLTKSSGTSNKSGGRGGSFGIGKFAPFACSSLRTVFYSTYDINKTSASQGVARLTTFKNKKNETTQGIGFYGDDKNSPTYNQYSLNPTYSRLDNTGTDIFIAGFTGEKGWDHQMVASILDGFLYAIYTGALVVDVDGIAISKDTLSELMVSHKDYFKEHADEYYRVLTDNENARSFTLELKDDPATSGTLTLRLMIEPTFNRRVAMIRQTGMKIKDKGNINGIVPFAGTLLIEGDAINSYLRNLENPENLTVDQFRPNHFLDLLPQTVHVLHPCHLILLLVRGRVLRQQFGHHLLLHRCCVLLHLHQVRVQAPVQEHRVVQHRAMVHQVRPAQPAVLAQRGLRLMQGQVREKIIPGLRVVQIAAHIHAGSFHCFDGGWSF